MSERVPTLVYGDLREAGLEVLARGDLDLRWALTLEEALAVSRRVPLQLVLASDHFALAYLEARKSLSRTPPCLVVLGPEGEGSTEEFRSAGAAALISAADATRVVEAISELTGVTFRSHPRVPVQTVVDVRFRDQSHFLYTVDLSASGVCIADFPNARYGETAQITFDLLDPPLTVNAMVVRTFNRPEAFCAGLCFTDVAESDRQRIAALIEQEGAKVSALPTGDVSQPPGTETVDLMAALRGKADAGLSDYVAMLKSGGDLPTWLAEISTDLTASERAALAGSGPDWATTGLHFRIDLGRRAVEAEGPFDIQPALDFVGALAGETKGATPDVVVDATAVRAAILRSIYALQAENVRKQQAKKPKPKPR